MREILFRGKRVDNGEWVEGFYIYDTNDRQDRIVVSREYSTGTFFHAYAPRVLSKTVGEYTGLIDKNGNKIFEGDIVKDSAGTGKVIYDCGCFLVRYTKPFFDEVDTFAMNLLLGDYDKYVGEIIGNIHDNPELLEVKDE